MTTDEPPVDTMASEAEDEVQGVPGPDGSITIPHGPAQWAALATFVASLLGALAIGITTAISQLPAGMSDAVGATMTGIAAALTGLSLGIYAAIRYLNGKLHQEAPSVN